MKHLLQYILLLVLIAALSPVPAGLCGPLRASVIFSADNVLYRQTYQAFSATLKELGYGPERLQVFVQKPNPDLFSWANSARRADAAGVDALVTFGLPVTRIALRETPGLPIVFADVFSPLEARLAEIQKPTPRGLKGATGIYCQVPIATLVKTFADMHGSGTITAVFIENDLDSSYQAKQLKMAANVYGLDVQVKVFKPKTFKEGLRELDAATDAFFISSTLLNDRQIEALIRRADELMRPVLGCGYPLADLGALVSIESDAREQGRNAAERLVKVLAGTSPTALGVETPHKVDLVLNLPAAEHLGFKIPFKALTSASRIIR